MVIFQIEPDYLYAVKYSDQACDEYNRIFEDLGDFEKVNLFFEENKWKIDEYYIRQLGIAATETEAFANQIINESVRLEEYFEQLIDNTVSKDSPNLFSHFKTLEGFENEDSPAMKSYGLASPSMIRVYAIEVDRKCYIIFYSGIKLRKRLSECPDLKDNVIRRARSVISFLKDNGITTVEEVRKIAK